METTIVDIITQGGPTGVFAVYAWWMARENSREREKTSKMWMTFLETRNGKTERYMVENTKTLSSLTDEFKDLNRYLKK